MLPEKMPRCLSIILTCFPDILTWHANILPEKNAKLSLRYFHVSLGHLNIPLRHLAGKKNKMSPTDFKMSLRHLARKKMSPRHLNMSLKHFPWKMPRCLQDILTCLSDILPETKIQDTLPEKNAKMSPRHLNMSPTYLSDSLLNMSPRHLNMSLRHLA